MVLPKSIVDGMEVADARSPIVYVPPNAAGNFREIKALSPHTKPRKRPTEEPHSEPQNGRPIRLSDEELLYGLPQFTSKC